VLEWRGAPGRDRALRGIPLLPEIDLPPGAGDVSLPGADLSGLPGAPEVIGLPPAPEWLSPEEAPGADRLPPAPEVVWLPPASRFLGLPARDGDFAYPDLTRDREPSDPPAGAGRQTLPGQIAGGVSRDAVAAAEALGGLSASMGQTNERIVRILQMLRERGHSGKDLGERIHALQERARRLRERIAGAIVLHERYAQALILNELAQRQSRLEDYLRQARLELAKTYDLETATQR
jgi:hypothetical protein